MPNEATPSEGTPAPQAAPQTPATPAPITSIDQIPQNLRNQLESQHRKGLQQRLADAEAKAASAGELRNQTQQFMEQLSGTMEFEEGSDLGDVALQLSGTLDSMKTEKEKLDAANTKQAEQLAEALKAADGYKSQYENTLINNATMNELAGKVVPGKAGELVAQELSKVAKVGEDGAVGFEIDVTDENGHTAKQVVSAEQAVKSLEANVSDWGFAFKSTVNSGTGGDVVDGIQRTGEGGIDWDAMTKNPAKFFELMEKNPGLIEDSIK